MIMNWLKQGIKCSERAGTTELDQVHRKIVLEGQGKQRSSISNGDLCPFLFLTIYKCPFRNTVPPSYEVLRHGVVPFRFYFFNTRTLTHSHTHTHWFLIGCWLQFASLPFRQGSHATSYRGTTVEDGIGTLFHSPVLLNHLSQTATT